MRYISKGITAIYRDRPVLITGGDTRFPWLFPGKLWEINNCWFKRGLAITKIIAVIINFVKYKSHFTYEKNTLYIEWSINFW